MAKLTLKDISKALNVSVATVSKALSDSYEISEATKQRVRKYAEENDFSINKLAQGLKLGRTNTIGVIACSINNDFVSQTLEGIQESAIESKYNIIIMQSLEDEVVERSCIEVLKSRGIDGLLISPVSENSNLELLENLKLNDIPVVLFDRIKSQLKTSKFGVENFEGAFKATEHLLEQGCTNILHITGSQLSVAKDRFDGFKAAIINRGLIFNAENYIACDLKDSETLEDSIRKALKKAFDSDNKPDAIFGGTELITIRILGILAEMNISVPNEVAVIGFSNTKVAFALNPALSTIYQPAKEMGYLAMNKLVKMIKSNRNNDEFEIIQLETSIHLRKSSLRLN